MTTHVSAAAAAGAANIPALIGAGAVLAGVVITQFFGWLVQKRTSSAAGRSAARKQLEEVTGELIAATTELQRAVRLADTRWNSLGPRGPVLAVAVLELVVGASTGELGKGVRRGVRSAVDWNQRAEAAVVAELSAPTRRVEDVLARAVLLADQDVVNAAVEVHEALIAVTAAYAQPQTLPWGKKAEQARAGRAAAETALQDALGELIVVSRERLHPTPPPRWWIRAGRRLMPAGRRRSAIAATVPAQRAGDDTTTTVPAGAPALPAAAPAAP
jgi:hypothetical protein